MASGREATTSDPSSFVPLVEAALPSAYRLAAAMLRSETEAEDAVQEAIVRAWRSFGRFKRDANMKTWLLTIVANECRRQRKSRWFGVLKVDAPIDRRGEADSEFEPERLDLRRALYRLPYDQRLVVILRYYVDLDFAEVAQILKISTKAAKSRTYRALDRLRLSPEVLPDE